MFLYRTLYTIALLALSVKQGSDLTSFCCLFQAILQDVFFFIQRLITNNTKQSKQCSIEYTDNLYKHTI